MFKYFTNINKTDNNLSPLIIEHKKKTKTYGVRIPASGFGHAQH